MGDGTKDLDAIGKRDAGNAVEGMKEKDERYFAMESGVMEKDKDIRGRGATCKQKVMVLVEEATLEDPQTGDKSKQVRHFMTKVLAEHASEAVDRAIGQSLGESFIVSTDKYSSCMKIAGYVELHLGENIK